MTPHRTSTAILTVAMIVLAAMVGRIVIASGTTAPEFTHHRANEWLNSAPLTLAALRGKPVLIEFWTFDCINCRRSIDWMKTLAANTSRDELAIVSVHTPELSQEKIPDNVRAAVRKLGIGYPVMLDTDYSYWNALDNQYWPAFYLVDAQGRIVARHFGELHVGDGRSQPFERAVREAIDRAHR